MNGIINTAIVDDFTVLDLSGVRKAGITLTDFTKKLYNPSGTEVSGTIAVTITELELGNYRVSFTPNVIGIWKLVIIHDIYFPQGKENDYKIYNEDFDTLMTNDKRVAYSNAIYLDTTGIGTSGTTYPTGTYFQPSNNLTETLTLASTYNIKTIKLKGSLTLDSSISGYIFEGNGPKELNIITLGSQNVLNAKFNEVSLIGTSGGQLFYAKNTLMTGLTGLNCQGENIAFKGNFTMASGGVCYIINCNQQDSTGAAFNMNANSKIILGNYNGVVSFTNLTNSLGSITVTGFHISTIANTVTAGQVYLYGIGLCSNGGTPEGYTEYMLPPSIFKTYLSAYTDSGTFGKIISDMATSVSSIPTNPMLNSEDGSSFYAIPDMAKETTLTSIKGTDFEENVDSLVNLSHNDIEITSQLVRDAMLLSPTSGIPATGSIDEKLNNIPTNTMLNTEDGSSFISIPDMAKETSLTSVSGVISAGFVLNAKEISLDDIKGTGFAKDTDSLKNLSHTDIEITAQTVRDAMKLAPSSGTIATDSIDEKLNDLKTLNAHVPSANFDPY